MSDDFGGVWNDSGGGGFDFGGGGDSGGSSSGGGLFSSGNLFSGASSAISGISAGIGAFQSADAFKAEAGGYKIAAAIAHENAGLTEESTAVKQYQQERTLNKSLGSIHAEQAGAGFGEGGSSMFILRDSASQGHLANAMIGLQGQINENAYLEQEQRALGEQKAAEAAAKKAKSGGAMDFLGTALSIGKMFF